MIGTQGQKKFGPRPPVDPVQCNKNVTHQA